MEINNIAFTIKRDRDELVRILIDKYKLRCHGHDFGKYRLSHPTKMKAIMKLGRGFATVYGQEALEIVKPFLEELHSLTGEVVNVTLLERETAFETPFSHHPEQLTNIFRWKDIFSNWYEYRDNTTGETLYTQKWTGGLD